MATLWKSDGVESVETTWCSFENYRKGKLHTDASSKTQPSGLSVKASPRGLAISQRPSFFVEPFEYHTPFVQDLLQFGRKPYQLVHRLTAQPK